MAMRNSAVSLRDIESMIGAYRARATALRATLAQIDSDMAAVEATVAAIAGGRKGRAMKMPAVGGARGRMGRGRHAGGRRAKGQDLASIIEKVLAASKPLKIPAIVAAVKKAGYESSSPSFARIVGMRLGDRKRFKRVGRGVYTAAKK